MPAFSQARQISIAAPPASVQPVIDDFHRWTSWSPWEERDPDMERTFTGPERGVGAHYTWSGDKKVGSGTMEVTASSAARVAIDLEFLSPYRASNKAVFTLTPDDEGTRVAWTMTGRRNLLFEVMGRLFFDRAIARDFDRGLARLKSLVEAEAGPAS